MAGQNLGRSTGTRKKKPNPRLEIMKQIVEDESGRDKPTIHRCTRCGFSTTSDVSKFSSTYSQLYACNDFRLPVCKTCLDELYEKYYLPKYGDEYKAVRVLCQKFDVYYNRDLVDNMLANARPNKHFSFYVQKTSLQQYSNRTYDTTIAEEDEAAKNVDKYEDMDKSKVSEETVKFWGFGFCPEDYEYLDGRYVAWSASYNIQSEAMSSIFRNICVMELQILKGIQANDKVDALYRQLNDYMNSAGIQPKQSSENTLSDSACFGTLIKKWEDEKPIPKAKPEWEDVDGIRRYISVYFLGHLCKMFGFQNQWSALYDEEIAKYTVNKPEISETDVNTVGYDEIFGSQLGDE